MANLEDLAQQKSLRLNSMMVPNAKEKQIIRAWYEHYLLRFAFNGTVLAKRKSGGSWGMLYTRDMLDRHVATIRNAHI